MNKIRKGDQVIVLTGRDKGKRGTVLARVDDERLIVEGVNVVKKHVKPNPMKGTTGGVVDKTLPIHQSNIAIFNAATGKADRVGIKLLSDDEQEVAQDEGARGPRVPVERRRDQGVRGCTWPACNSSTAKGRSRPDHEVRLQVRRCRRRASRRSRSTWASARRCPTRR